MNFFTVILSRRRRSHEREKKDFVVQIDLGFLQLGAIFG
jgi:hypothetical protein